MKEDTRTACARAWPIAGAAGSSLLFCCLSWFGKIFSDNVSFTFVFFSCGLGGVIRDKIRRLLSCVERVLKHVYSFCSKMLPLSNFSQSCELFMSTVVAKEPQGEPQGLHNLDYVTRLNDLWDHFRTNTSQP